MAAGAEKEEEVEEEVAEEEVTEKKSPKEILDAFGCSPQKESGLLLVYKGITSETPVP